MLLRQSWSSLPDFDLNWQVDESQFGAWRAYIPPPVEGANALPPLHTAIREQIGLKLEAASEILMLDTTTDVVIQ